MELLVVVAIIVLIAFVIVMHHKNEKEDQQEEAKKDLQELIEQLDESIEANNQELQIWKNIRDHHLDLTEPSACFNGHEDSRMTCAPWDCPVLSYNKEDIFKDDDVNKQIANVMSLMANLETLRVYDICNSAIFFGNEKIVFLNLSPYEPKNILANHKTNIKETRKKVTIKIDDISNPILTLELPEDKAEEFMATMDVFRRMK